MIHIQRSDCNKRHKHTSTKNSEQQRRWAKQFQMQVKMQPLLVLCSLYLPSKSASEKLDLEPFRKKLDRIVLSIKDEVI
jgi:hypothetical protein